MADQHHCPLCGSPLLSHVRRGKLGWFCRHCDQEVPYSVDENEPETPASHNGHQVASIAQNCLKSLNKSQLDSHVTSDRSFSPLSTPLTAPFTVRDVLHTSVRGISQFLQADRVIVAQITPSGEISVIEECRKRPWKTMLHLRLGQFLSFQDIQRWQQGKIQTINDVHQEGYRESSMMTLDNLFEVKAKIVVPILQNQASLTLETPQWSNCEHRSNQPLPGQLWGLLIAHQCSNTRQWTNAEIGLLSLLASQIAIAIQQDSFYQHLNAINQKLEQIAFVDRLTQISNRCYFEQYFTQEWRRMAREKQPLSLILCDVDFFKSYNDTYGHLEGDFCLQKIAQAINTSIHRPGDLVARYGGEEFVILLPNTKASGALYLAEQIRSQVKGLRMTSACQEVSPFVTLSLGVASFIPDESLLPAMLISEADHALYEAKKQGRDRVGFKAVDNSTETSVSSPIIPSSFDLESPIDRISNLELLRSYVAYFVSRGIKIASPIAGELSFEGLVYQYHGYHQEFLTFWQQFEHRSDYQQLHLQGDSHSFGEFLQGDCTVNECARCNLPIINPVDRIYDIPSCTLCLEDCVSGKWCELNKPISHNHQCSKLRVLIISPKTEKLTIMKQWLASNDVESIFINEPKDVESLLISQAIDSIVIDANISEHEVKTWANQLREHPQLKEVPIIALSDEAGQGIPWINRKLGIEDYLVTPLNGETLAMYLRYLTKVHCPSNVTNIYWFPR
ncbi:response regulator receiver modulated diguanylate cyclase [Rippkaea orientalis PCC 8801]|uniref:Response regulator receiver modulated diguanylate cyclase n=1 Tax=Rippkaea orientalis (strain PCC 8801 / RF-1) TaxID=41431 RepID=B7K042_RIPO1|nr:diguanylate cyclase [Rippkaea orientalis]ACK66189.1 response regulator receiver modulated diguanylate cyclase [Rippkaea orientalis PCC 8801]